MTVQELWASVPADLKSLLLGAAGELTASLIERAMSALGSAVRGTLQERALREAYAQAGAAFLVCFDLPEDPQALQDWLAHIGDLLRPLFDDEQVQEALVDPVLHEGRPGAVDSAPIQAAWAERYGLEGQVTLPWRGTLGLPDAVRAFAQAFEREVEARPELHSYLLAARLKRAVGLLEQGVRVEGMGTLVEAVQAVRDQHEQAVDLLRALAHLGLSIQGDGNVIGDHSRAVVVKGEGAQALLEALGALRRTATYDDEATYRRQVAERYRELEFVGIPELKERRPITVEDLFVRLRAEREVQVPGVPEEALARRMEGDAEEGDVIGGLRAQVTRERVEVGEALRGSKRLVALGDPGAGKTTLLKYLAVICAEGRGEAELGLVAEDGGPLLPLFVPLREFAAECAGRGEDYGLLDYFYTHAREHLLLHLPPGFFEGALADGRCLVCLDGLDEVWAVGQRKAVADAVRLLAGRFPRSRYVVTSRVVGYEEAPLSRRDFRHHTLLPLEEEDVRAFVLKWYAARERDPLQRERKAADLLATIARQPRIRSLAANPLLLTIVALVHRVEAELPHGRVRLYDKCVTALVDTWEEIKGLTIREKQRPFYCYRRRLLERLAYELHARAGQVAVGAAGGQSQVVREGDLELLLARFLTENRRLGLADDPDGARAEARAFVRLARGRTGLLVERGRGSFGFPHLTFQEYLAACDVENRCIHRGVEAIWEEIAPHLHDPHWREVVLLLLGSLNQYDELPTLLVEKILEAGREDKFEPVLHRHLYLAARALADRVDVADDLHRRVVAALLEIARAASSLWERRDTFTALSWLEGDGYAVAGLLALAEDEGVDFRVRSEAVWALGRLGRAEEKVLDGLLALAEDEGGYVRVRITAASALGRLGRGEEKVVDGLLALAEDEGVDAVVRSNAAKALGQLGRAREAEEVLVALVEDEEVDAGVRSDAVWALGGLGRDEEKAVEVLLALAEDEEVDPQVRFAAAGVLGQLGRAREAEEVWLALAGDEGVGVGWVRGEAARALGGLGRGEEGGEVLLALAWDEGVDPEVRGDAARALGRLGRAGEAGEVLLALAEDERMDPEVRGDAARALGRLGCAGEEIVDGLLALARDERVNADVRQGAYISLKELGGSALAWSAGQYTRSI